MQIAFWISFLLLFYTYLGYGLMLLLFNRIFKKRRLIDESSFPAITFIVPAYNEAFFIEKKIHNSLELQYPAEKLSFLFVTDGSTDTTPDIIRRYPDLKLLHQHTRQGKSAAINRAMRHVNTPIVILSDANTLLHPQSIIKLVRHYADEKVGGVSGEKRIADEGNSAVGFGERLYWQYESLLKKANADFYTIVGAAGEIFSVRTSLYKPLNENIILDDFVISAQVCQQDYRFLYEEEAYGIEASSASMNEESKRKIRISAGCFQALFLLKGLLNPFKNFRVTFQYISHRVLRWIICPLLLPAIFVINAVLFMQKTGDMYTFFFWTQCAFYFSAFLGWLYTAKKTTGNSLLIPYYFSFMILSQYAGFYRFVRKKQTVFWEKANRKSFSETGHLRQNI
jgi:cellulose synthase/poly-beta-1,6-N-acetylglucosamine synthase-like glycosyltransferase